MRPERPAGASGRPRPPRLFAAILFVYGVTLTWPGGILLALGGTSYYLLAGLALTTCSILVWRGDIRSVALYALFLLATLGWAVWESGLDGWALLPRISLPIGIGMWFLTPWASRRLSGYDGLARSALSISCLAGIGLLIVGGVRVTAFTPRQLTLLDNPVTAASPGIHPGDGDWPEYGRDKAGSRFSPLTQLTPENAAQLELVWSYRIGRSNLPAAALEVSPLKIGRRLFMCTGESDVLALDAETGAQLWKFSAHANTTGVYIGICRGVAYYSTPGRTGACAQRILSTTIDRRLVALDAQDGRPCKEFGTGGEVNLERGMGEVIPGYYRITSAPQVIRGNVVIGGWISDGQSVAEPSGVVRAFNAITGQLAWSWDVGRPEEHGEPAPGESYTRGTPNSWAPISADEELGLVYLPTGNATPDYVGQHRRPFDDAYSSSVVALDAQTGALRWSFQTTHHDIWDYDVASQASLVDFADGRKALLQPTKRGELFLLDRSTGEPLADVQERRVPATRVPGEVSSPTQPFSVGLPSFAGPAPSEQRMWGITPFDQLWCRIKFREARFEGTLTPVGLDRPTVVYPVQSAIEIDRDAPPIDAAQISPSSTRIASPTTISC